MGLPKTLSPDLQTTSTLAISFDLRQDAPDALDIEFQAEHVPVIGDNKTILSGRFTDVVVNGGIVQRDYSRNRSRAALKLSYVREQPAATDDADSYQHRQETHYLASVELCNAQGVNLERSELGYKILGAGVMQKRVLASITHTIRSRDGSYQPSSPSHLFEYYGEAPSDGVGGVLDIPVLFGNEDIGNYSTQKYEYKLFQVSSGALYGALKSFTTPEGSKTSYRYKEQTIGQARRELEIKRPQNDSGDWQGVDTYFGSDYAVVIWKGSNKKSGHIYATVYQWHGRWVAADLGELPTGVNGVVHVEVAADFFAIVTPGHEQSVRLFSPNKLRLGQWDTYTPTCFFKEKVSLASGRKFLAVLDTPYLHRFTRDGDSWRAEWNEPLGEGKDPVLAMAAGDNFIVIARATPDNSSLPELRLYYLDDERNWWLRSLQVSEPFFEKNDYQWDADSYEDKTWRLTSHGVKALELYAGETFILLQAASEVAHRTTIFGDEEYFEVYRHFIFRWPEDYARLELEFEPCLDVVSKGVVWDCIKRHNSEVVIKKKAGLVRPRVIGDQITIDVWEDIGLIDKVASKAKQKKFVYRYSGCGWYEEIFDNDELQNNYVGQNSFSTTETGQAQYWEFNPSMHGWQKKMSAYKDGNLSLFEKLVWPIIRLIGSIVTLPLDFGPGLLVDLLFLNIDALIEGMTKLGGAAQGTDQFFSANFTRSDSRLNNLVYHRSSTGLWQPVGDLTPEPDFGIHKSTGKKSGLFGTVYEDFKLDHASTQFVENALICALERDQYVQTQLAGALPSGHATQPGFPKYQTRVQLFKNGVFLKHIDLPEGELVRHTAEDTSLKGINAFFTFKGNPFPLEPTVGLYPMRFGESLQEAIGLKLYRVINDNIQGPLTDFVVSQVTINDGYSDTHTHYTYDTASASMAPGGAGALYGKVTTTYSGESAVLDKSNGFTESLFHGPYNAASGTPQNSPDDESALYKGLLYQTTIFNHQGALVATNTTRWKAFNKKLNLDGKRTGYFVRSVATTATIDGATKHSEMEYCTGQPQSFPLDAGGRLPFVIPGCAEIMGAEGWHIDGNGRLAHASRGVSSAGTGPWQSTIGPLVIDSNFFGSLQFQYELSTDIDAQGKARFEAWINGSQVWSEDRTVTLGEGGFIGSATLNLAFDGGPLELRASCCLHGTNMDVKVTIYNISARTTAISTPVEVRNFHYDVTGKPVKTIESFTYGWQKYPALLAQNVLTPVVETRMLVDEMVTAASATTWGPANGTSRWAPIATYQAQRSTGDFDFEHPEHNPDWLASSRILARGAFGVVTETQDVNGIVQSAVFDKQYRLPVATFVHASIERHEAGYCGFEPYEQSAPVNPFNGVLTGGGDLAESGNWNDAVWQIDGSREQNAHTGVAALSGRPARIEPQHFAPRSGQTGYIISAWVKPRIGGRGGQIGFVGGQTRTITADKDDWQYVELITETPSENQKPFVSCDGMIDDFRFAPLDTAFNARVYDPEHHQLIASLDSNGSVRRTVYDHLQRPLATLGPDGQVVSLYSERLSRQEARAFNPREPNQTLTILPRKGGRYYRDFAEYAGRVKDPEHADPIPQGTNKGLRFGLVPLSQPNPGARSRFAVRFGAASVNGYIKLSDDQGSFVLDALWCEGMPELDVISYSRQISSFLLLLTNYHVYCFIDGTLSFRGAIRAIEGIDIARGGRGVPPAPGALLLEWAPAGNAALVDLLTFYDPIVSSAFSDGLGRVAQTQHLAAVTQSVLSYRGGEAIAVQTLYDGWGNAAVQTKPVPIGPGLVYDNQLASDFDWKSGVMRGLVDHFYDRSYIRAVDQQKNDNDYAYVRQVAESSPLARIIESGGPGAEFKPGAPHSIKHAFGQTSQATQLLTDLGLSSISQHYRALMNERAIDDTRRTTGVEIFDLQGNLIASRQGSGSGAVTSSYGVQFTRDGTVAKSKLPNAFSADNSQAKDRYTRTLATNFRGLLKQSSDCDRGAQHYIYDRAGRLRFRRDPSGANDQANRILYWKYDPLGHITEEGQTTGSRDDEALQSAADTAPEWPDSSTVIPGEQTSWRKRYFYDISPNGGANVKGRLSRAVSRDESGQEIEETYQYDMYGRVSAIGLRAPAFGAEAFRGFIDNLIRTTTYRYDNQGNVIEIGYPSSAPEKLYDSLGKVVAETGYRPTGTVGTVHCTYTTGGRIAGIGTANDRFFYAAYEYNVNGSIKTEWLNQRRIQRDYSYDFQGRLVNIEDRSPGQPAWFAEALSYRDSSGHFKDGNIAQVSFTGSALDVPHRYVYEYDEHDRLLSAKCSALTPQTTLPGNWDVKGIDGKPIGYDANGNIVTITQRGTAQEYVYEIGTNRLAGKDEPPRATVFSFEPNELGRFHRWTTDPGEFNENEWYCRGQFQLTHKDKHSGTQSLQLGDLLGSRRRFSARASRCVFKAWVKNNVPDDKAVVMSIWTAGPNGSPRKSKLIPFTGGEWQPFECVLESEEITPDTVLEALLVRIGGIEPPVYVDDVFFGNEPADYRYDANGRVIGNRHLRRLQYEPLTGLTREIETESRTGAVKHTSTIGLRYGAQGQRVLKTAISVDSSGPGGEQRSDTLRKTLYLHGTNAYPLCEESRAISITARTTESDTRSTADYVYGVGGLIAMREGEHTYFFCKDHLGSVRVVLDQDSQVCAGFDYLPFGELIARNGQSTPQFHYLYTGQEFDWEIGLYNYRARMYDPRQVRFYAPDPAHQYASPYEYVGNNPINVVDPTGTAAAPLPAWQLFRAGVSAAGARLSAAGRQTATTVGTFFTHHGADLGKATGWGALSGGVAGGLSTIQKVKDSQDAGYIAGQLAIGVGAGVLSGLVGGPIGGAIDIKITRALLTRAVGNPLSWSSGLIRTVGAVKGGFSGLVGGLASQVTSNIVSVLRHQNVDWAGTLLVAAGASGIVGFGGGFIGATRMRSRNYAVMHEESGYNVVDLHNPRLPYLEDHYTKVLGTIGQEWGTAIGAGLGGLFANMATDEVP